MIREHAPKVQDFVNRRYRHRGVVGEVERAKNRTKSKVRARIEHPIGVIKRVFGFAKVRYRGLRKNVSPARHLRAGQSVHRAPASAALPAGVMCRQPGRQTVNTPQYGTNATQLPRTVAGEPITMLLVQAPAPYSDGVSRRFRR